MAGSLGAAVYPDDAGSAAELLDAADVGMYRAKAAGRAQLRGGDRWPDGGLRFPEGLHLTAAGLVADSTRPFVRLFEPLLCFGAFPVARVGLFGAAAIQLGHGLSRRIAM